MKTLTELFEEHHPSVMAGPAKEVGFASFMAGAAMAVRQICECAHAIPADEHDRAEKIVIAIAQRAAAMSAEFSTWALLSRAKYKAKD